MLANGQMKSLMLLGQKVLLARQADGQLFALRDFCPHRGVPLSYGRFDGREVECCYHGWRFDCTGSCTKIPSLLPEDPQDVSRIRTASFPCQEAAGVIWVFIPEANGKLPNPLPPLPALPGPTEQQFKLVETIAFPCNIDHAVIGLMDPAHGPFVHASWWWRTARSMHRKEKHFEPTPFGFKMAAHKPSSNSRAYRILGAEERKTEIAFSLPSIRTEHIQVGADKHIVLLTALTPQDANNTVLHQFIYTNIGMVNALLPVLKPFGKAFIKQDLDMVIKQQEGLQGDHPGLMLLGDADQQAIWYFRLKKHWLESQQNGTEFVNPLKARTLRWIS